MSPNLFDLINDLGWIHKRDARKWIMAQCLNKIKDRPNLRQVKLYWTGESVNTLVLNHLYHTLNLSVPVYIPPASWQLHFPFPKEHPEHI